MNTTTIKILGSELIDYKDFKMPETLYKYRSWADKYHQRLITNREVFFAAPTSFEDKFDCKNPVRWDLLTDEEILNKYYQDSHSLYPNFSPDERMEFAIEWANHTMIRDKDYVAEQEKKTFELFDSYTGVLSLTEYPAEIRMWNKYCISHTGFCVGFDAKIMLDGIGTGGGIVLYHEELPIIYPTPKQSFIHQTILQIFNKYKEWDFEKEYRTYKFRNQALTIEERTVVVPAIAFKEIILGALMDKDSEDKLLASIPNELKHIKLKKAYIDNGNIIIKDYNKFTSN
jgi:hypothetical protein